MASKSIIILALAFGLIAQGDLSGRNKTNKSCLLSVVYGQAVDTSRQDKQPESAARNFEVQKIAEGVDVMAITARLM